MSRSENEIMLHTPRPRIEETTDGLTTSTHRIFPLHKLLPRSPARRWRPSSPCVSSSTCWSSLLFAAAVTPPSSDSATLSPTPETWTSSPVVRWPLADSRTVRRTLVIPAAASPTGDSSSTSSVYETRLFFTSLMHRLTCLRTCRSTSPAAAAGAAVSCREQQRGLQTRSELCGRRGLCAWQRLLWGRGA